MDNLNSITLPFPEKFRENFTNTWGEKECLALLEALREPPHSSIRLNPFKTKTHTLPFEPVKWCDNGYYISEKQNFTFDPKFHSGAYYVQDASSMFLEQWIKKYVTSPSLCLDMCAAPGGKSTHLLSLLPEGSFLVANEPIPLRNSILVENLSKWGLPNSMVTQSFPEEFEGIGAIFDVILTDVPCSGEGMFRKDRHAVEQWSEELIQQCVERQKNILSSAWKVLKPNGLLIYSTCTFNSKENEEMMQWAINEFGAEILSIEEEKTFDAVKGKGEKGLGLHFFPHHTKGEGLYLCGLRKPLDNTEINSISIPRKKQKNKNKKTDTSFQEKGWVLRSDEMRPIVKDDTSYFVAKEWFEKVEHISMFLRVVQVGIPVAFLKGRQWVPHPALALSTRLNREKFPSFSLTYREAITYLRGETLPYEEGENGNYILVMYQSFPLGWVKKVGNRLNNLYPTAWRIRSTHTPDEPLVIGNELTSLGK